MARVMLVMPHLPQRMGAAYLGQQYVAASLIAAGHEVRCLDLAAVYWDDEGRGDAKALAAIEAFGPDLVGMTLFTYNARRGYELARALRGTVRLTLAGGPHATVCPTEPVEQGFDASVVGEGEETIVAIARWLDTQSADDVAELSRIPGVAVAGADGPIRARPKGAIADLDGLPFPLESYPAYDPAWYAADRSTTVPGGLMTSRGCPARCTFCANYVTGRTYRWRSTANVLDEMRTLSERHGVRHFPFWDDAFTARPRRVWELCDALVSAEAGALRGVTWTCITPGNMVRARDLERMYEAGCRAINFGLESGDYNILEVIQKGVKPERVKESVRLAREVGMTTIVNFMFGFPEEDLDALQRTHDFMVELGEYCDFFNNRGVLVPFPGTAIYDRHHEEYELDGWWLDPARVPDEPNLFVLNPQVAQSYLEHDPTLDQDFFRYSDAIRDKIAECVRFKARHNERTMRRMSRRDSLPEGSGRTTLELQQKSAANVG